jgi:hypothetical protein
MRRSSPRGLTRLRPALLLPLLLLVPPLRAEKPRADDKAVLGRFDERVKPSDRKHWAFQPVRKPRVPQVKDRLWLRNPIDAFVLAKLEEKGWKPSPPADGRALLRRVYFDLLGLPPTPAEEEAFLKSTGPGRLERVVDDLLSRPGYGERWGRHWLDLVRYAETNGYERDAAKPHVWRYRDYVIRAFNDDKPYDRFVLEQLAGDELPDASAETLIGTGYYRLGPWDDEPADPKEDRFDQLDDMVSTTTQVFLGLTLGCARCHNHKYEALTMHDYYRMVAIFAPLRRPQRGRDELDLPAGSPAEIKAWASADRQIATFTKQMSEVRQAFRGEFLKSGKSKLPAAVLEALRRPPARRTPAQHQLVLRHFRQFEEELTAHLPAEGKRKIEACRAKIQALEKDRPQLARAYFLYEPSPKAPATHLLYRGKAGNPGPEVAPGLPTVLAAKQPAFLTPDDRTSRRRLTLARWIASADNPLTPRVIVNRVWQFHFGEGLVRTPSDFGIMGEPPTHPELLDWLTDWFVSHGWSLKRLHRLILTSNTYRMSKRWRPDYGEKDPENQRLWRFPYRRLEVEAIRDAMLAASGRLNPKMFGPSMYPQVPKEALESHSDPDKIWKPLDEKEASRRTVYAFIKRSLVVPMLEVLDLCDTTRSSARRAVTTVAPQALTLMNGDFVNRQARHFAGRLLREAGQDAARQVERAYRLALCRPPTATERTTMLRFLEEEAATLQAEAAEKGNRLAVGEARRRALVQMCRVIFNLNEFVYTD